MIQNAIPAASRAVSGAHLVVVPNLASSATSLLIAQAASVTEKIRVGSGGVMLPNHAPLMVAEQYGTIANMYGDRIDLGLGVPRRPAA